MKTFIICVLALSNFILAGFAQAEEAPKEKHNLTFGAFIDTYYAYNFNNSSSVDRAWAPGIYVTTAGRNNEFNINLAMIEAKLSDESIRGRLALQTGTSVTDNFTEFPASTPVNSGNLLTRDIQEASVGYKLADKLWIDAGIFPSHIGFESFISRDNWTYTRSMVGDFSPYYQSGIKLSYEFSKQVSAQLHVINGWQNVYETNAGKSVGAQVVYAPNENWSFTDNLYVGQENMAYQNRLFNDFIVTFNATSNWQWAFVVDVGSQNQPPTSTWYGAALLSKFKLGEGDSVTLRGERYVDKDGVILGTTFDVYGVSVNYDKSLTKSLVWRTEVKDLVSPNLMFVKTGGFASSDVTAVTSLALTL